MKEITELNLPDNLRYTEEHEWLTEGSETVKAGITDYAQDQLGDIVFVELPPVGDTLNKGEEFGTLESVKAVSELYMPISGEIVSVNVSLENEPNLVNQEPYKGGWIIEIKPLDVSEMESLFTKGAYFEMLKGQD
ncbi:MAG: glycine cleavage system protein GcvH [Pseudomonadota bacterium]